jgi:cytochrome b involved in lipid metabolism
VYDVTDFIKQHPGGNKILLAAGGALEPFWSLYAVHKTSTQVPQLLRDMKIGRIAKADLYGACAGAASRWCGCALVVLTACAC